MTTTENRDGWAADHDDAPRVCDLVTDRYGHRWEVLHVGRMVWLRPTSCARHDVGTILLEPWNGF